MTFSFTGSYTDANYQTVVRNLTFASTSDDPTAGGTRPTRTIGITVTDGNNASSNTATSTITVTPVDDAPVAASIEGTALAYAENAAATPITSTLTLSDACVRWTVPDIA